MFATLSRCFLLRIRLCLKLKLSFNASHKPQLIRSRAPLGQATTCHFDHHITFDSLPLPFPVGGTRGGPGGVRHFLNGYPDHDSFLVAFKSTKILLKTEFGFQLNSSLILGHIYPPIWTNIRAKSDLKVDFSTSDVALGEFQDFVGCLERNPRF